MILVLLSEVCTINKILEFVKNLIDIPLQCPVTGQYQNKVYICYSKENVAGHQTMPPDKGARYEN